MSVTAQQEPLAQRGKALSYLTSHGNIHLAARGPSSLPWHGVCAHLHGSSSALSNQAKESNLLQVKALCAQTRCLGSSPATRAENSLAVYTLPATSSVASALSVPGH